MNNSNNINFTGIKNIGYIRFTRPTLRGNTKSQSLSMVLSDDFNGKDLKEFYAALDKIPKTQYGYGHPFAKDILNIECTSLDNFNVLLINGRPIKVDDDHLSIFSYIARLTRKIAGMDDKNMVVNKTYKEFAADELLIFGEQISKMKESGHSAKSLDYFLNRSIVRDGAKKVNSFIQKMMNQYFGI